MIFVSSLQTIGRTGLITLQRIGVSGYFLIRTLFCRVKLSKLGRMLVSQLYQVGVLSLIIIIVSALFIGMVIALQGYNTLQKFGSASELGQLVALSVVRELGPVVTALLFAGRAGTALTAEIALMKTTKQLASMEMMAVDPIARIVAPRFWAGFISLPLLTVVFNMVSIYGGYLVGVKWLQVDAGQFWNNMQAAVNFHADVINGIIKSVVFGFVVTWIALYQGYYSKPSAAGISEATTNTVVYASLAILGLDFALTAMMMGGW